MIFVIGANPSSNHPRFIHMLKNCRDRGGEVIVSHSTISGNVATSVTPNFGTGGGIYNAGILTVTNSTISGNSAGHEGGDGVNDDDVHGTRADEGFGDFEGLFAGVGLGDVEIVDVYATASGVGGVEGVLHIDKGAEAAALLGFGDDVLADGGLARRFGAVDFDNASARHAAHAQGDV